MVKDPRDPFVWTQARDNFTTTLLDYLSSTPCFIAEVCEKLLAKLCDPSTIARALGVARWHITVAWRLLDAPLICLLFAPLRGAGSSGPSIPHRFPCSLRVALAFGD